MGNFINKQMFSKPILVAGLVATVQSANIKLPSGILPIGAPAADLIISATTSCMDCLRLPTDLTGWVYIKVTSGSSSQLDVW